MGRICCEAVGACSHSSPVTNSGVCSVPQLSLPWSWESGIVLSWLVVFWIEIRVEHKAKL